MSIACASGFSLYIAWIAVISDVRANGDKAVRRYSQRLDGWSPKSFRLSPDEVRDIVSSVPETVREDLRFAQHQVRRFAQAQRESLREFEIETLPGVYLGHRHVPIQASGAYAPGGRYPLTASAHMIVLTAKVAGVERVAAATPPNEGLPPRISVAAMHLGGADEIHVLGGVQAIAALALGTETIDPVHILTGPGNAYVAEAKRQLFGEVGIDLFAGPTETLIVADESADPFTVAVDLLNQAEHGPDSPCVLITTSAELGATVIEHIDALLPGLPTNAVAGAAWRDVRALRRQSHRDQPRAAHARGGPLHRRPVGGQVPQDRDLPGGPRPGQQRVARQSLRTTVPTGTLGGTRPLGRSASRQVR